MKKRQPVPQCLQPDFTFGPCAYCEWPQTRAFYSRSGPLVPVCALCFSRLSDFRWVGEDEAPECAI